MIYFKSYSEYCNFNFKGKIEFCIASEGDVCYYFGNNSENQYHNLHGAAMINLSRL